MNGAEYWLAYLLAQRKKTLTKHQKRGTAAQGHDSLNHWTSRVAPLLSICPISFRFVPSPPVAWPGA
jgi:hypothetical protein